MVIRRFDCILQRTKNRVLQENDKHKKLPLSTRDIFLCKASGYDFYNISKFTFETLLDAPNNIESNFNNYLQGFSANARDILEKFNFDKEISKMASKDILYITLKEFSSPNADLHPDQISNLEMGYIFEEVVRRFSESHNE
jgi:type I restriction enzyme M protein